MTDGAVRDFTMAISDGAISSCEVVVVSCCATDLSGDFVSIVISESTRTALECALRCDYSGKKTDKFSKHGYKIFLFALCDQCFFKQVPNYLGIIPLCW